MKWNTRKTAMFLIGTMALTGVSTTVLSSTFSQALTVQAAGKEYTATNGIAVLGEGSASIVIAGNKSQSMVGKKFKVYKLFHAENSVGGESINYTYNPFYEQPLKNVVAKALQKNVNDVTEYMVIDYIHSLNNTPVEGTQTDQKTEGAYSAFRYFVETLRDEIENSNVTGETIVVSSVREDNSVLLSGMEYGYYIIDEITAVEDTHSASSLCMVDTANPLAQIKIKSDYPNVIKKIQEDDPSNDITDAEGWNDIADYEIGQIVPYKYESNIPNMNGYDTYYYAWHDVMDEALTFQSDSVEIVISGELESGKTKSYKLTKDEYQVSENPGNSETFKVTVDDIKSIVDREFNRKNNLNENVYGQSVVLKYNAVLNDKAALRTGRAGFENDVRLEFSNNPDSTGVGSTGYTPWDTVVCFTYKVNVLKTNNYNLNLEGAKFRLYSDETCKNEVFVKKSENGYIVINRDSVGGSDHIGGSAPENAVEMVSAEDGTFTIYGLDQGTYYLKEVEAPDGYRVLLDPITIQVIPTFTTDRDDYVKGEGATQETLQKLEATAYIKTFYSGILKGEDKVLTADAEDGSVNLNVVNKVGMKLPVTGTSTLLILFAAGSGMMVCVVIGKRKKREQI